MKNKAAEIVTKIIRLYASGRFPSRHEGEFKAWFASGIHRKEKNEALEDIWNETVGVNDDPGVETREAFRKLSSRLGFAAEDTADNGGVPEVPEKKTFLLVLRRMHPMRRIAAVLIPVLLFVGATLFYPQEPTVQPSVKESADVRIMASHTPQEILLPDSSRLWINARSEVRYKQDFCDGRRVELSGEGYFDIQPNPGRPFTVRTKNLDIKVLGTVFNVSDYADAGEITISLYEGSVRIDRGEESHTLTAKQELVYSKPKRKTEIYELRSIKPQWLAEPMEFRHAPLSELLRQTTRRFEVEIGPLPAGIPDDTLSIHLDGTEGLEETLFRLAKLSGKFNFRIEEGKKVIIENNE